MYTLVLFGVDLMELNFITVVLRLGFAMLCGSVLGIERMRKRRAAGMRTFILICSGSCLIMMISQFMNLAYGANGDLGRMGAQVISGIGFICAGTILLTGNHKVMGLTTAASLWSAASIGLAIGAGFYAGAVAMFVIMITTMLGLDGYRERVGKKSNTFHLYIVVEEKATVNQTLRAIREMDFTVSEVSAASNDLMEGVAFLCLLKAEEKKYRQQTLAAVSSLPGVYHIEEI